jgi:hypothetical protein
MIPKSPDFDVKDSQFFRKFTKLPSPEEVRSQAKAQHLAGVCPDNRKTFSLEGPHVRPPPVIFKDLGLFVKWGSAARISEGQCLYALGQLLKDQVPVPEIYGGGRMAVKLSFIWSICMRRLWSKHGRSWNLMTAFRSVVSSGQSTTTFATLNRSQQNHS